MCLSSSLTICKRLSAPEYSIEQEKHLMIRFALLLLMSLAVSSEAVAAKWNNNPSDTGQNTNIEHLSQLFYPPDILDKFEKSSEIQKEQIL